MKPLVRTAIAASLALALGACAATQPTPVLAPAPAAAVTADNAALLLRAPALPGHRLATSAAASEVQGRRANGTRTALIVLGVAAAAIVIIVLAGGAGGSAY